MLKPKAGPRNTNPAPAAAPAGLPEGIDGAIARVSFPSPTLKASIDAEKPAGAKIMDLIGRHKESLFTPRLVWVPIENFRDRVAQLFDARLAVRIVRSCETQSSPRVAFETKEVKE